MSELFPPFEPEPQSKPSRFNGIPLRMLVPNLITMLSLCSGLTAIRFGLEGKLEPAVIATGGSIVSEPGTFELLLSTCMTIWLRANPEEHMARVVAQGDTRPMAANPEAMDDLRRILDGRAAFYSKADLHFDTSGMDPGQAREALLTLLQRWFSDTGFPDGESMQHTA